jgi:hypothetical protein
MKIVIDCSQKEMEFGIIAIERYLGMLEIKANKIQQKLSDADLQRISHFKTILQSALTKQTHQSIFPIEQKEVNFYGN